jgi:hypothetical protein
VEIRGIAPRKLEGLLDGAPCLQLCYYLQGDEIFRHACALGYEGTVSKRLGGMTSQSLHRGLMDSTRLDSQNHIPGIGIISITSTVAPGIVRCGLLAKRAAAASCDSACTME